MQYIARYKSPLGDILLASDDAGLTGIWFEGQRYFALHLASDHIEKETDILMQAKKWLDIYFSGHEPDFLPPLHVEGTSFHREVCEIMLSIPYGKTMTYGEIAQAQTIASRRGIRKMSARAVGGAVGHNEISIIIPCHRVVGANGNLTGYGGGISRKVRLLELEGVNMTGFYIPRKGTAL